MTGPIPPPSVRVPFLEKRSDSTHVLKFLLRSKEIMGVKKGSLLNRR